MRRLAAVSLAATLAGCTGTVAGVGEHAPPAERLAPVVRSGVVTPNIVDPVVDTPAASRVGTETAQLAGFAAEAGAALTSATGALLRPEAAELTVDDFAILHNSRTAAEADRIDSLARAALGGDDAARERLCAVTLYLDCLPSNVAPLTFDTFTSDAELSDVRVQIRGDGELVVNLVYGITIAVNYDAALNGALRYTRTAELVMEETDAGGFVVGGETSSYTLEQI